MSDSPVGAGRAVLGAILPRAVPGLVLALMLGALTVGPEALDRVRRLGAALHGEPAHQAMVCSYRLRTGSPCVGCGGTRAFRLTSRGEWRGAVSTNVLGAAAGATAWLLAVVSAWCTLRARTKTILAAAGACAFALLAVVIVQAIQFLWTARVGATSGASW